MIPFNDPIYENFPPPPVDPRGVFLAVPCHDGKILCSTSNSCLNVLPHLARNPYYLIGMSDICLARNLIAHKFVEHSKYEWLVWVDSDIIFSIDDWLTLWDVPSDMLVTCPYARKVLGEEATSYGLGFTRVHRSVLEAMRDLQNDDGAEVIERFYMFGETIVNFHRNGVSGNSDYHGEDRGFFFQARYAGFEARLESRTRLRHVGPFEYGYPDQIADSANPITGAVAFGREQTDGAN